MSGRVLKGLEGFRVTNQPRLRVIGFSVLWQNNVRMRQVCRNAARTYQGSVPVIGYDLARLSARKSIYAISLVPFSVFGNIALNHFVNIKIL